MRQKTRDALEEMVHCAVADALTPYEARTVVLDAQLDQLHEAVKAVKPVSMDLTQELADDIAKKMHGPLTIPQQMSDWIKEQAQHHDVMMIHPLGYGPNPGTLEYVLKANGTLVLLFKDTFGVYLWQGTFLPPGFGKEAT